MEERQDLFDFKVDTMTAQELNETSRWSRVFSILVFAICAIVLLILVLSGSKIADAFSAEIGSGEGSAMWTVLLVISVIVMTVVTVMMYFLFRSANRIREGLRLKDQALFNKGLADMKAYFAILGVLSILGLLGNLSSVF